jgi:nucleoside-triphosphatase
MKPGGFYTKEIREGGIRQGFRLCSYDGREWLIAHVDLPRRYHVGKYGVDVNAIDVAVDALLHLEPETAFYLVDEIGKMECESTRFIRAMHHLLQSDRTVIATVGKKGTGFIAEVKQRRDCLLWEITRENRDTMPRQVLNWIPFAGESPC